MRKKKKAIVDIDNTLWQFCDALHAQLKRIKGAFPHPEEWNHWDFWKDYCSEEQFFKAIVNIHLNQDDERHLPYPEAGRFLQTLKERDFHIIIASHRADESRTQTMRWLETHGLAFDELHLSFNKAQLFDDCYLVVDDAPHVLQQAKDRGLLHAGLLFPWNRDFGTNGTRLFNNLDEILDFLFLPDVSR